MRDSTGTQGARPWEDGDRDWSDAAIRQRMPRTDGSNQNLLEGRHAADISSEPSEGTNPPDTLISNF